MIYLTIKKKILPNQKNNSYICIMNGIETCEDCFYCRATDSPDWRECYCAKHKIMVMNDDSACDDIE